MKWRVKQHGTESGYQAGCKCPECMGAHTAYNVSQRRKMKDQRTRYFGEGNSRIDRMMAASARLTR